MDSLTIKKLLRKYKCFKGVFPSDKLPFSEKLPLNIIVNTDPSDRPGQHWIAISINNVGRGYYFDSFGFPPLVENIYKFINLKSTKGWSYNKKQIQDIKATTCGKYCILFIIFTCNNMNHKKFIDIFAFNTPENERKIGDIFKTLSFKKRFPK